MDRIKKCVQRKHQKETDTLVGVTIQFTIESVAVLTLMWFEVDEMNGSNQEMRSTEALHSMPIANRYLPNGQIPQGTISTEHKNQQRSVV
jgi:hypothetical protein